jgi:hypothetical protein
VPAAVITIPSKGIVDSTPLDIVTDCPCVKTIGSEGIPFAVKEPVMVTPPDEASIDIIVKP